MSRNETTQIKVTILLKTLKIQDQSGKKSEKKDKKRALKARKFYEVKSLAKICIN